MVESAVVPERTALVNVDMQNRFVHGSPFSAPDGLAVQERINRLAAACRGSGILVIHASHMVRQDDSNIGILGEIAPAFKQGIVKQLLPPCMASKAQMRTAFRAQRALYDLWKGQFVKPKMKDW